jgi:hypothetical protein
MRQLFMRGTGFHFMIISTAGGSEKAIWFLLRRVAARGNVKAPG